MSSSSRSPHTWYEFTTARLTISYLLVALVRRLVHSVLVSECISFHSFALTPQRIILNITRRTKIPAAVHCSVEFPGSRLSQYTNHLARMAFSLIAIQSIASGCCAIWLTTITQLEFGSFSRSGVAYAENLREILAMTVAVLLAQSTIVCVGRIGKHTVQSHHREDKNQRQNQHDDRIDLQPGRLIGVEACYKYSLAKVIPRACYDRLLND